jgi:hypothetical protein
MTGMHPDQPLPRRPGHQRVRAIALQVETLDSGRLRISSPHARGWATTAATPSQLFAAIQDAYTEVQIAAYARAQGKTYDLDQMTTRVPGDALADGSPAREKVVRRTRRKSHDPANWTRMDDGRWRSPTGRAYREDSRVVQDVITRRRERDLPC